MRSCCSAPQADGLHAARELQRQVNVYRHYLAEQSHDSSVCDDDVMLLSAMS